MRISFVLIGLCLFALSFSHASSENEGSKPELDKASGLKEEKSFLPPHVPIFKKPYFKHIPIPVFKPKPHPIPIFKPNPVPISVPIYKPKPIFKHVPVPVYIPKPTPISVPIYKPHPLLKPHPFFKKPMLPPYFSHPKKPCPPNTTP